MDVIDLKRKGLSHRQIAKRLGISRNTVKKYIKDPFSKASKERKPVEGKLTPYVGNINFWLEDDNYQGTWIFDRIKGLGYTGSYETVKKKVREIKQTLQLKAYIAFETIPGQQAQVDFGEFHVVDGSGHVTKLYLFCMIMGYSRKLYAEFITSCDMPTFLDCHIRAFSFFGGIPQEILYDRMRNVYIPKLTGKGKFNDTFMSFALHYGFKPMVAPAYAAWVKGKVERPYSFIRENFWRGYYFTDLKAANHDIYGWLMRQEQRIHGTTYERIDKRFEKERPCLSTLPFKDFDTSWRIFRKVRKDCVVRYDCNRYVVSHKLVGQKILLRVKDKILRVFTDNKLLVTYTIPDSKGNLVQDPRFYAELRKDRAMNKRKYLQFYPKKGRAHKSTVGLKKMLYDMDVYIRPLSEYQKVAEG